jgi:hypothetical protein
MKRHYGFSLPRHSIPPCQHGAVNLREIHRALFIHEFGRSPISQFAIDALCVIVGFLFGCLYLFALGVIVYVAFKLV